MVREYRQWEEHTHHSPIWLSVQGNGTAAGESISHQGYNIHIHSMTAGGGIGSGMDHPGSKHRRREKQSRLQEEVRVWAAIHGDLLTHGRSYPTTAQEDQALSRDGRSRPLRDMGELRRVEKQAWEYCTRAVGRRVGEIQSLVRGKTGGGGSGSQARSTGSKRREGKSDSHSKSKSRGRGRSGKRTASKTGAAAGDKRKDQHEHRHRQESEQVRRSEGREEL